MLPVAIDVILRGRLRSRASLSYVTSTFSGSGLQNYSFAGTSIGTATSDRTVIVGIFTHNLGTTPSYSSVVIGGVTATVLATNPVSNVSGTMAFYAAMVPTGTTATIAVNTTATQLRMSIAVWAAYGLRSYEVYSSRGVGGFVGGTLNVNTVANGIVLAMGAADAGSFTWTGVTERVDSTANTIAFSAADASGVAAAGPMIVSDAVAGGTAYGNHFAIALM